MLIILCHIPAGIKIKFKKKLLEVCLMFGLIYIDIM